MKELNKNSVGVGVCKTHKIYYLALVHAHPVLLFLPRNRRSL